MGDEQKVYVGQTALSIQLDTNTYVKYLCKYCIKGNHAMTIGKLDLKLNLDKWI